MMSVLIKGMEMPSSCSLCFFAIHDMCVATGKDAEDWWTERPEYCPLISVPPHGRLIDADVFLDIVYDKYKNAKGDVRKAYSKVLDLICAAGDIIPAEEEQT